MNAQILSLLLLMLPVLASAQSAEELAKRLANPVGTPNSVTFQSNWNYNVGPLEEGERFVVNIQPVIPFSINENWNLYSRTIIPVVHQQDIFPGSGTQNGLGDTVEQIFFSPKKPTRHGIKWGVGPAFLLPTGTDELLTFEKWGAGPTAVALKQDGPWTLGALATQIWSFAGADSRPDINQAVVQPFVAYTTPEAWSFIFTSESAYNWDTEEWTVPLNFLVSKVFKLGNRYNQLRVGPRYIAESPNTGPHGWGFRVDFIVLLPQ
jgi:hypothetical protein